MNITDLRIYCDVPSSRAETMAKLLWSMEHDEQESTERPRAWYARFVSWLDKALAYEFMRG